MRYNEGVTNLRYNEVRDKTIKQIKNMKNKKLYLFTLVAVVAAWACGEEPEFVYDSSPDNIYFNFADTARSNITYSFAYTPEVNEHIIYIPVKISGQRVPVERSFRVELISSLTTAQPGLHYEALKPSYVMAKDSGTFQLPVVLYNTDEMLLDSTMVLAFELKATPDFSIEFPTRVTTKISFSNRLERPVWWNYWESSMGDYSRNKHYLFLISSGMIDLNDPGTEGEKTLHSINAINNFKAFVSDPIAWVQRHPEYAFDELVPGMMYVFYEKANPGKQIQCMLMNMGPMGSRYAFFDNNGAPTIFYV